MFGNKMTNTSKKNQENKREKFVKLAERRTINALTAIRSLGNLSNKSNYEYSDADARKIISSLMKELDGLKARFSEGGGRSKVEFKL